MAGQVPNQFSDYLNLTKDGLPPLYPSGPRWVFDDKLQAQLTANLKLAPQVLDMMLGPTIHQRKLDSCWRCFVASCDALAAVDAQAINPARRWVEELLTPSGWQLSAIPAGEMTAGEFKLFVLRAMQNGTLSLLPTAGSAPREAPGKCDHCGKPCVSECICGEHFCSRECLRKDWKAHRSMCEQVVEQAEFGTLITYIEKCSPAFSRDVDVNQVLGRKPWKGGMLPGSVDPRSACSAERPPTGKVADSGRPEALIGMTVVLHGLTAKPELNGQSGIVTGWDQGSGRLQVTLEAPGAAKRSLSVRPGNVQRRHVLLRCIECQRDLDPDLFAPDQLPREWRRCKDCLGALPPKKQEAIRLLERDADSSDKCKSEVAKTMLGHRDWQTRPENAERRGEAAARIRERHVRESATTPRTKEVLDTWAVAMLFERPETVPGMVPGSAADAVRAAAHALLLEQSVAMGFIMRAKNSAGKLDGKSTERGQPRLSKAARKFKDDSAADPALRADACCMLSAFCLFSGDLAAALELIDMADELRENHAPTLAWRSAVHIHRGSAESSLTDCLRSRELLKAERPAGPHTALLICERTGEIGKLMQNLGRDVEAQHELEFYVSEMFSPAMRPQITDRERGHAISAQYMLVVIYAQSGEDEMARMLHEQSLRDEAALDLEVRASINFGESKALAQIMVMVPIKKTSSQRRAAKRTSQSSSERAAGPSQAEVTVPVDTPRKEEEHSVPFDAALDADVIHARALELLAAREYTEALWHFLVALFLSWGFMAKKTLQPVKEALMALRSSGVQEPKWASTLAILVRGRFDMFDLRRFASKVQSDADEWDAKAWLGSEAKPQSGAGGLLAGQNREEFSKACAVVFFVRDLSRAAEEANTRKYFYEAQRVLSKLVWQYLKREEWLTLMFESAYTNRAVGAMDEATRWSAKFRQALPVQPNAHWRLFSKRNEEGDENANWFFETKDGARVNGARVRAFARRQLAHATAELRAWNEREGERREAVRAEAQVLSVIQILRDLPQEEQDQQLLAQAALQLASTTGARPETADRAVLELERVTALEGWDNGSTPGLDVQRALDEVRDGLPTKTRQCKSCGELKPKEDFSDNQWRKGKRRCKPCQSAGVVATIEAQQDLEAAQEEAADFRRIHQEAAEAEAARVRAELARRNANEHDDGDCPICFEDVDEAERCALHEGTVMHWMCGSCLRDMFNHSQALDCPTCRQKLDEGRLLSFLHSAPTPPPEPLPAQPSA